MRVNNWVSFGCIMTAIALGVAIAVMVSDIATVKAGWCDARPGCFRDWVGALSGWAAAVAAGITLMALYDQLGEQRKQTDFILGESLPTFDAYSENYVDVFLRVVNWNRRTFVIDRITCTDADSIHVQKIRLEHRKKEENLFDDSPEFEEPVRVAAYDDRSKAPAICRIELQIFSEAGPKLRSFSVHGRLLGEEHRLLTLSATAYVKTIATGL